jgi:hypothetical protein
MLHVADEILASEEGMCFVYWTVGWFSQSVNQSVILICPSYFSSLCSSLEDYIAAGNTVVSARIISEENVQ